MTLSPLRSCLPLLAAVLAIGLAAGPVGASDERPARDRDFDQQARASDDRPDKDRQKPETADERERRLDLEARRPQPPGLRADDDDWVEIETKRVPIYKR